ncbi:outer membrane protein transport protein [Sulfurimonas sp.]|jgi:long-chain fatty acid transport protein|uniref:OmpP1/FadL family transporter n=1 Tax=Sulfurimonas sp. TaxID=2022749 RepID=UPI0026004B47|nr:outer membrane protein transport protein [Sulfurimonas sp.]MCK9472243.1 outer membrane protein transport protein [Sulfurimonas sp.]
MKKTIKLAIVAALALGATSAFATNGDTMIGVGAKAVGMGGVGIGMGHGAESALSNPAMITTVEGTQVSFGGTVFMPDVKTNLGDGTGFHNSDADLSIIPTVAIAQKATDNFYWGIGMYGVAGMGTDYRDATGGAANFNMVTNLQLMQFVVPLSYKVNGFSIGIAPILQYGSLDINFKNNSGGPLGGLAAGATSDTQGVAQDFGLGYTIGAAYEMNAFTVGASYKSAISMTYDGQISEAMQDFTGTLGSDKLEQPAELGIGASYVMGSSTIAFDYKKIKWSDADGYKDFAWEDQDVYMVGYQFAQDNYAIRVGYNYAKSPISDQGVAGSLLNVFNLLGFPAIVEEHYTIGGSYEFTKMTSVDLAYVYSPEASENFAYSLGGPVTSIETKHSQSAVTAQLNFNF